MSDNTIPDAVERARALAQAVTNSWHADAYPEAAYPFLDSAAAARSTENDLADTQNAYHRHLIEHRDELRTYPEFALDYGLYDNPDPEWDH